MAIGDFDDDGAVDVLVSVNDGTPILLQNNAAKKNHWLGKLRSRNFALGRAGRQIA
jgi:hypothetical protein